MQVELHRMRNSGATALRAIAAAAVAAGAAVSLTACDPCAGIVGCDGDPRFSLQGQLIEYESREPAAGVEILFERTGGAALQQETVVGVSDRDGRFDLEMEALEVGEVVGRVTVRPPDRPAYTIEDVRVTVSDVRGDGSILAQRWVVDPYFDFLGELYVASTERPVGVYTKVKFRRTGGIPIEPDTFVAETDFDGRFILSPKALAHGEVVGDLTVTGVMGERFETRVIKDVRFSTTHVERPLAVRGVWYLGLTMDYFGELRYRNGYAAAADVPVHFRRTGGIDVEPAEFSLRTDAGGRFPLRFTPDEEGVLLGTLTFEMAPPVGTVSYDVEIPTLDVAGQRRFESWMLGPGLNYAGEVRGFVTGKALEGTPIRLVRTGGIRVRDEVFEDTVDADGRFRMSPFPLEEGVFEGVLTVDLPDPQEDFVVEVTLPTFNTDELRLAGVWYVPGL